MDSSSCMVAAERDCNALGGLFHIIINDLRGGANNWDDLLVKANKFHMQLKATISASTAFLDSFQKIADLATTTRSGTKEIGSALTRLCLRHRSVEAKLKSFTNSMQDSFILPLQDRVEEWKRIIAQLDKEHSKELKRLKQLRKKQTADGRSAAGFGNTTFRIKRNPRSKQKNSEITRIGSMYDINRLIESMESKEKYFMLEEVERNYVRRALIEERSHYCLFFSYIRPVVEEEISMLAEVTHLEEVLSALIELTLDPYQLPPASESLLSKMISESAPFDFTYGEPDSPCSTLHRSRKSSISSITSINSLSTDSFSLQNCKSLSQPNITPEFRPKSIASQDSGFISHDYNVPNIGRLIISNNNKTKSISETASMSGHSGKTIARTSMSLNGTLSSKANSRKSVTSCRDCLDGEYASTEQIHSSTLPNNNNSIYALANSAKQPIYANIGDDYSLLSARSQSMNNSSDGSITPTNHANFIATSEEDEAQMFHAHGNGNGQMTFSNQSYQSSTGEVPAKPARPKLGPFKTNPPKPPLRLTSTLSSGSTKPPTHQQPSGSGSSKSTRIYVMQPDNNNSPEFPPPPPEAYVNYATPTNCNPSDGTGRLTNSDQVNNNSNSNSNGQVRQVNMSCCDYSLASSHLVLCNDINCLKGMQHGDNRKSVAMSEAHYLPPYCTPGNFATLNSRKSYAFESPSVTGPSHSEPHTAPVYSDCSGMNHLPPPHHSQFVKPFCEPDRARSVPPSRRFHSTINLSHQ